jgi:hypothetical protein
MRFLIIAGPVLGLSVVGAFVTGAFWNFHTLVGIVGLGLSLVGANSVPLGRVPRAGLSKNIFGLLKYDVT